jgi:hypothetical protein
MNMDLVKLEKLIDYYVSDVDDAHELKRAITRELVK